MASQKKESYYKILGTTANIGNARIKEKYIKAVKRNPPEMDPEGFEKVREAYETLKDPEKRKQYDLMRKYGANVEELLEKVYQETNRGNIKEAKQLLSRASKISPDNPSVMMISMLVAVENNDIIKMDELFEDTLEALPESALEEKVALYNIKANILLSHGFEDEALDVIEQGKAAYPKENKQFASVQASIYLEKGNLAEAWEAINTAIPEPENETFDDIELFIFWINLMFESEKWNEKAKVQSRFRRFLKKLTDEFEKESAYELLLETYEDFYDEGMFREADFFIDLVKQLNAKDYEINEMKNKTKVLARVQKEIERLQDDEDAFPLLFLQAFEWFYKDIIPSFEFELLKNNIPSDMLAELEEENELFAAGIIRLRKKYPSIYKHFKEDWDRKFEDLTKDFNRQMKRDLRKLR